MRKVIPILLFSLIGLHARSETFSIDSTVWTCQVHDAVITAGKNSISCLLDGERIPMDLPDGIVLKGVQPLGEGLAAIADKGILLFWDSPYDKARKTEVNIKGEFIGISSVSDRCHILTDCSEIISIDIARQIRTFDFRKEYSGFYGNPQMVSIATGASSIYIAAVKEDGSPAVFTSSKGNVWSERELTWIENGKQYRLDKKPVSISYEADSDTFILVCEDDVLFYLPACSHCNRPENYLNFAK